MDIISEDIIRILIFLAIVIWYIFSLIKRATKQKDAKKTIKPNADDGEISSTIAKRREKSILEAMFPELAPPPIAPPIYQTYEKEDSQIVLQDKSKVIKERIKKEKYKEILREKKRRKDILSFSRNTIVQGIIFSEIIGKPKSQK